jgi:hypothetical protein
VPADGKRVELVDEGGRSPGLPSYIGIGLLGSLVVGFGPLRDAAQGHGSFEDAMTRYLACLLVCLVGASAVGRILDSAPPPVADKEPQADATESADAESEDGVTT